MQTKQATCPAFQRSSVGFLRPLKNLLPPLYIHVSMLDISTAGGSVSQSCLYMYIRSTYVHCIDVTWLNSQECCDLMKYAFDHNSNLHAVIKTKCLWHPDVLLKHLFWPQSQQHNSGTEGPTVPILTRTLNLRVTLKLWVLKMFCEYRSVGGRGCDWTGSQKHQTMSQ